MFNAICQRDYEEMHNPNYLRNWASKEDIKKKTKKENGNVKNKIRHIIENNLITQIRISCLLQTLLGLDDTIDCPEHMDNKWIQDHSGISDEVNHDSCIASMETFYNNISTYGGE